eukprot:TRINITY_DN127033_c0_g1_i1.p1 TRINITY_DN127033_c0_g1~~TRINITY_DN127033_c0_g1_i1.p1  ORF type:complete len:235 (+),score=50.50 TRINITY_DN127033_c0_g1_i1:64-705(+)
MAHMAAEESIDELFVRIGQEVADAFVVERRPQITESIAANKAVATRREVFDAVTAQTKEKVRAEVRAARGSTLGRWFRKDIAAQVESFEGDDEIEVLPAAYLPVIEAAFNKLYEEQWAAYLPKFEEDRASVIKELTAQLTVSISDAACKGVKKTERQARGLPVPRWVGQNEKDGFAAVVIAGAVSARLRQAGYSASVTAGVLTAKAKVSVSWK